MPTYEYQCEKCKKSFECYQSMKDASLTTCPKDLCRQKTWGKGKVKRQMGMGAGLLFKGSGFYITDYRSAGYHASANAAAKSESGAGETKAAEAGKPEAKPPTAATEKKTEKNKPAAKKKED
jgi:putative FmdB family regulatory protein